MKDSSFVDVHKLSTFRPAPARPVRSQRFREFLDRDNRRRLLQTLLNIGHYGGAVCAARAWRHAGVVIAPKTHYPLHKHRLSKPTTSLPALRHGASLAGGLPCVLPAVEGNVGHAMETGDVPPLALYLWRGDLATAPVYADEGTLVRCSLSFRLPIHSLSKLNAMTVEVRRFSNDEMAAIAGSTSPSALNMRRRS